MRRFGVEIELTGLGISDCVRVLTEAGIRVRSQGYTHAVMADWKVVPDASVRGGCEVVSPPLQNTDAGFAELATALRALEAAGAGINRSCGLHVHVEATDLTAADIANVVVRYARHESEIDAFMPPSRRGSNNQYCMSMVGVNPRGTTPTQMAHSLHTRYYKVNLQSFPRYGTLEFRQHSGSVNATKVTNWVKFLLAFVEASKTRIVGGTVAQHVTIGLGRSERTMVDALRRAPQSIEALAEMADVGIESAKCVLSRVRQKGYAVRLDRRTGLYSMTVGATVATATAAQPANSLWTGVDSAVRSFYENRTRAFSNGE